MCPYSPLVLWQTTQVWAGKSLADLRNSDCISRAYLLASAPSSHCSGAGDCLYISTLGNFYHITLRIPETIATGSGSGIVAKTVGQGCY